MTTLQKEGNNDKSTFRKFTFLESFSLESSQVLRKYKIECVFSNKGKFKELLGNPKDKPPPLKASGIY